MVRRAERRRAADADDQAGDQAGRQGRFARSSPAAEHRALNVQIPGQTIFAGLGFYPNGQLLGRLVVQGCANIDPCQVLWLPGLPTLPLEKARQAGLYSVIKPHKNIKVVAVAAGGYLAAPALKATQDVLSAHPDLNVIVSSGDQMIAGAVKAAQVAGKAGRIKMYGNGCTFEAKQLILQGKQTGCTVYLPRTEGRLVVQSLIASVNGTFGESGVSIDPTPLSSIGGLGTKADISESRRSSTRRRRHGGWATVSCRGPPVRLAVTRSPSQTRGRLTDEAYRYVRDGILRGQFRTGSVLPEVEIARAIGISRTPVRQALGRLLNEGLVEVGSRRQVIVRGFTAEHRAEFLLLREALEGVAVQRASEQITEEEVDYLRLLVMRQQRVARRGDDDAFLDLDEEFHLKIVEAGRLPILYGMLRQLRGFVRVARLDAARPRGVLEQVSEEHAQIVDALERHDAPAALAALKDHLHRSDYAIAGRRPAARHKKRGGGA